MTPTKATTELIKLKQKEPTETQADEAAETPEQQALEQEAGIEQHGGEDFKATVDSFLKSASPEMIEYLKEKLSGEEETEMKGSFSDEGMPAE